MDNTNNQSVQLISNQFIFNKNIMKEPDGIKLAPLDFTCSSPRRGGPKKKNLVPIFLCAMVGGKLVEASTFNKDNSK